MSKKITLKIENMMCEKCVANVDAAIRAVDGVSDAKVTVGKAVVFYDGAADEEKILAAVIDAGFPAKIKKGLF